MEVGKSTLPHDYNEHIKKFEDLQFNSDNIISEILNGPEFNYVVTTPKKSRRDELRK